MFKTVSFSGSFGEVVMVLINSLPHTFNNPREDGFEKNIVGKAENAGNQHFLLFLHCFLLYQREKSSYLAQSDMISANAFNFVQYRILSFGKDLNLSLSKSWFFMYLQKNSFENTAGKGKLLVTSNFSFSLSVFYPFGELSAIYVKFRIIVCKLFEFRRVKICRSGRV